VSDTSAYGVEAQRKEHSAIRSGKKELSGNVEGSLGPKAERVDGQRLYMGLGTAGMGTKPRSKADAGPGVNRAKAGSFKIRKRSVK
jgi:hypothetical protein